MPVTVQIPDTGAFLEATFTQLSNPTAIIAVGNYIYCCGSEAGIAKLIRVNKDNFADFSIFTFPNDGKHVSPVDMCHAPSTNKIYVLFRNGDDIRLAVAEVSSVTGTMTSSLFIDDTDQQVGPGGICTDNTHIYVCTFWGEPSVIYKKNLSTLAFSTGFLTGLTKTKCIRYANGKLFTAGLSDPDQAWVARSDATTLAFEQSSTFPSVEGEFAVDKFGVSASHLWVGNRNTGGIIKRFLQSNLSVVLDVDTRQASKATAVDSDGANIWALFENGKASRINPTVDPPVPQLYTVNPNQGYQREVTGDGIYVFTAT